ncbi:hypothetical protein [Streptomyces canus]|uniref:hypothetical protein n=1 Tax=Streptomyces canus TaxID=58343 RepID=UPI002E31C2C9|nr:hypothetical protein [Streptomyces canus]
MHLEEHGGDFQGAWKFRAVGQSYMGYAVNEDVDIIAELYWVPTRRRLVRVCLFDLRGSLVIEVV